MIRNWLQSILRIGRSMRGIRRSILAEGSKNLIRGKREWERVVGITSMDRLERSDLWV